MWGFDNPEQKTILMPVTITVSDVRTALYQAAGGASAAGDGAPSTALLGQWFHEALERLVGDDPRTSARAALADVEPDLNVWKRVLLERAYTGSVGPQLMQCRAGLQEVTPQVLSFRQALQAACDWLAELSWSEQAERTAPRATPSPLWQTLAQCLATEVRLTCELREPGWTDSVLLVGVADAVLKLASTGRWCVIEFKLGQTSPEADLGQACLYHLMLSAQEDNFGEGTLALISFRPERHEQLFAADALASARQRLIKLIGRLAGVAPVGQE